MTEASIASSCQRCRRPLGRRMNFVVKSSVGDVLTCLRCALGHIPMLRRSAAIALVVGFVQVAVNQGDLIVASDASSVLMWKIPLTYLIPFAVATLGALTNARRVAAADGSR